MSKYTDIGVEKHGHVGLIEIQQSAAELLRHLADQPDRRRAGRIRQGYRNPRLGARGARQGVLRRRQFQRSEAAGAGSSAKPRAIPPTASARSTVSICTRCASSATRSRSSPPCMAPPSAAGSALRCRRTSASPAPRRASAANFTKLGFHPGFGLTDDASRTGRQEQCGTDFLHQPPRHRRGSHQDGPRQSLRAAGPGARRGHEARRRKSPSARRSACSPPAPPCAPASPTACSPRPITNSPSRPACAPPKTSRKASRPRRNAAWRISRGGKTAPQVAA